MTRIFTIIAALFAIGMLTAAPTPAHAQVACTAPAAPLPGGLQPKYFTWNGHRWSNDSGMYWNVNAPYAIKTCSNGHVVFELHDTANDKGQKDPSFKRRSEIGASVTTSDKFFNNHPYWLAFSVKDHFDCPSCMKKTPVRIGQPLHWPVGASPAVGLTVFTDAYGKVWLQVTTCGDDGNNNTRAKVPYTLDAVHDFVMNVIPNGTSGYLDVWMDGKQILHLTGVPVGSKVVDGYTFRIGSYGQPLHGNRVVEEIGNIAPFASGDTLIARISAPPAW